VRLSVLISTLAVSGFLAWMMSVGHAERGIYGDDSARVVAAHHVQSGS
jgi:hypothetical protein